MPAAKADTRKPDAAATASSKPDDEAVGQSGEDAPLEVMLADAALGPVRRMVPGAAGVRLAAQLAARPVETTRRNLRLTGDLAKVLLGRSDV